MVKSGSKSKSKSKPNKYSLVLNYTRSTIGKILAKHKMISTINTRIGPIYNQIKKLSPEDPKDRIIINELINNGVTVSYVKINNQSFVKMGDIMSLVNNSFAVTPHRLLQCNSEPKTFEEEVIVDILCGSFRNSQKTNPDTTKRVTISVIKILLGHKFIIPIPTDFGYIYDQAKVLDSERDSDILKELVKAGADIKIIKKYGKDVVIFNGIYSGKNRPFFVVQSNDHNNNKIVECNGAVSYSPFEKIINDNLCSIMKSRKGLRSRKNSRGSRGSKESVKSKKTSRSQSRL